MPPEERAVVVAAEEARLLAFGAAGAAEAGGRRLRAGLRLRLAAEREPQPAERRRVDGGEHVALVLARVHGPGDRTAPCALDELRVMAGREPAGAHAIGEGKQLVEAEAAVAADTGVRRRAPRVGACERLDDRAAELLAQVERHVRQPSLVTGAPRRDHRGRRAARPLVVRRGRVDPEPERHADRVHARREKCDGAVDAAAHRHNRPGGIRRRAHRSADRVRERVDRERLAADRRRLEQGQPFEPALEARGVGADDPRGVDPQPDGRPCPLA